MERAKQREKPARRRRVHADFSVEAFREKLTPLVVQRATAHIKGLDPAWRRGFNSVEIVLADHEIVLHHSAERGHREQKGRARLRSLLDTSHGKCEPLLNRGNGKPVRSLRSLGELKKIALQQVKYRDLALVIDFGRTSPD